MQFILTVTFTNAQKLLLYLKNNLRGGGESWDLFSNQQMGLEVQKNLGLLMLRAVEGVVNDVFVKRPKYW